MKKKTESKKVKKAEKTKVTKTSSEKRKVKKKSNSKKTVLQEIEARRLTEEAHPIGRAIDKFLHRVWGIELSADTFIPQSEAMFFNEMRDYTKELKYGMELIKQSDNSKKMAGMRKAMNSGNNLYVLIDSNMIEVVENGYFLSLFCSLDLFSSELLSAIYLRKPELYNDINRSIEIRDMMRYESLEDIKSVILQYEIESLKRKSYVDQFKDMESRFDIKLREFEKWPHFVECAQRRNLHTHCDGIVSEQYLRICKTEGYSFNDKIKIGDKLTLGKEYLHYAFDLILEVGVKLGHTFWRKIFPNELEEADNHLIMITYNLLKREKWRIAQVIGEFAIEQKKHASDITKKIFVINYAIALKFGRKHKKAKKVLGELDWSATSNDFKIAEAVLQGKYEDATKIMKRIGKEGEIVKEYAYHDWPLFRKFRETKLFLKTYESIYGYPFTVKLERIVEATKADADKEIRRKKRELQKERPSKGK